MSSDEAAVRGVLDAFANALVAANARQVCSVLDGRANGMQHCGDPEREGIDAQLLLAIRRREDIAIESVSADVATAVFPDFRPTRGGVFPAADARRAQRLILERRTEGWRITDIIYRAP